MAHEDERANLTGRVQQPSQIRGRVGQRVVPARVAAAAPGPVVDARPGRRRQVVLHGRPGTGAVTHAGLEDDRRRPRATAVEVERAPADVDQLAASDVRWRYPVSGEPRSRTTDAHDVDDQGEGQPGDDGHGEAWDKPADGVAGRAHATYRNGMCRSIKTLRRPGESATTGELEAAARQYVRKLSGFREPSVRNREAFDAAVAEIAAASRRLVEAVGVDVEDGPDRWIAGSGRARRLA